MEKDSRKLVLYLGALSLFLSTLEYLIPKLPFLRIGLANIPLLLGLPLLKMREIFVLTLIKIIGQALVGGTLTSYVALFSFASTLSSTLVMVIVYHLLRKHVSFLGISLFGSLASNIIQALLSVYIVFGEEAKLLIPLILIFGLIAGLATGLIAVWIGRSSTFFQNAYRLIESSKLTFNLLNLKPSEAQIQTIQKLKKRKIRIAFYLPKSWNFLKRTINSRDQFILGMLCLVMFLFTNSLLFRLVETGLWIILTMIAGKKLQPVYFLWTISIITLFHLFAPSGEVLLSVAGLSITQGALETGINWALFIVGQIFISLASIRSDLYLPGKTGRGIMQVLLLYQDLMAERRPITLGQIPKYTDETIIRMEKVLGQNMSLEKVKKNTSLMGYIIMAIIFAFHVGFLIISLKTQA